MGSTKIGENITLARRWDRNGTCQVLLSPNCQRCLRTVGVASAELERNAHCWIGVVNTRSKARDSCARLTIGFHPGEEERNGRKNDMGRSVRAGACVRVAGCVCGGRLHVRVGCKRVSLAPSRSASARRQRARQFVSNANNEHQPHLLGVCMAFEARTSVSCTDPPGHRSYQLNIVRSSGRPRALRRWRPQSIPSKLNV